MVFYTNLLCMFSGRTYSHHAHTLDYAATKNTEIKDERQRRDTGRGSAAEKVHVEMSLKFDI